ncbi:hypothetical protein HQ533_02055 [Candidatus Woesearchaeota archaeon]|nr:hypothetical protein [Candidatus Woesearchaeota archaeon]
MDSKIKKGMRGIILVVTFFALCSLFVSAANVGISPASIHFSDVLRGGYAEDFISVVSDSEDNSSVRISKSGEIIDWLTLSHTEQTSSVNSPGRIKLSVLVPENTPNGDYEALLEFQIFKTLEAEPTEVEEGKVAVGAQTIIVIGVKVIVTVTDKEIKACRAKSFSVKSTEKGLPVEYGVIIKNDGNVLLTPEVSIDIWGQELEELVSFFVFEGEEILPTVEKKLNFSVETNDLLINQYWTDVSVADCGDSDLLTFDVLEVGTLSTSGTLLRIINKVQNRVGDKIIITPVFENTGERPVSAVFKGEIILDRQTVRVLESDSLNVPINETVEFRLSYIPSKEGRYLVRGRVFYGDKRTYEKEVVFYAIGKRVFSWWSLSYIAIAGIILFLIYRMKKEYKRNKIF